MKVTVYQHDREGRLVEAKPVPELAVGHRVFSFGPGADDAIYAVCGPKDEQKGYPLVLLSSWHEKSYFGVRHWMDRHCRPVSMKYGIGFYWDDTPGENVFSEHKIRLAERRARIVEAWLAAERKRKEEAYQEQKRLLPLQNPHLKVLSEQEHFDYKLFRANVVADLKHHFPGTKFSVSKGSYQGIVIRWTGGAAEDDVDRMLRKWSDHETDWSGDYRDPAPTVFNDLFGGINYVRSDRELPEELKAKLNGLEEHERRRAYRVTARTSIPDGAYDFSFEYAEKETDHMRLMFRIPAASAVTELTDAAPVVSTGITIHDYSEHSIAVTGDTRPVSNVLKTLGGKFNFKLKCGPGWIFPKTREKEVRAGLGLA